MSNNVILFASRAALRLRFTAALLNGFAAATRGIGLRTGPAVWNGGGVLFAAGRVVMLNGSVGDFTTWGRERSGCCEGSAQRERQGAEKLHFRRRRVDGWI